MERIDVTSMSSKGQVVIPLNVRKRLDLEEGVRFAVLGEGDMIVLKRIRMPSASVLRETAEGYATGKDAKKGRKKPDLLFRRAAEKLKSFGAKKAYVFGSYARGEQKEDSDLDLIVEFSGKKGLLDKVRIQQELSDFLGVRVDLLSEEAISPYILPYVLKERRVILS